jgi:hypothetical protein
LAPCEVDFSAAPTAAVAQLAPSFRCCCCCCCSACLTCAQDATSSRMHFRLPLLLKLLLLMCPKLHCCCCCCCMRVLTCGQDASVLTHAGATHAGVALDLQPSAAAAADTTLSHMLVIV